MQTSTLSSLKEMTVLFAEDDPVMRRSLQKILELYFGTVLAAEDGGSALAFFESTSTHVVLLDLSMPLYNGLEVAERIRERDLDIPIIMLTAHNETQYMQKAVRLRLMDYLIKPVKIPDLEKALMRAVDHMFRRGVLCMTFLSGATFNRQQKKVLWQEKESILTRNEVRFLDFMLRFRGRVVDAQVICDTLSSNESDITLRGLCNLVYRLRGKVGAESVVNYRDSGYMIP